MKLSEKDLNNLLNALVVTEDKEIDCNVFLDRLGQYLESSDQEIISSEELLEVKRHLKLCAECREEYETLKELIDSDS